MSQTLYTGQSLEFPVSTGRAVGVFVTKGAYSLTIKSGPGRSTILANNSTTSQNYGPWASNVVVELRCEPGGELDFDVAVTPVDDRVTALVKTGASGVPSMPTGVGIGATAVIKSGVGTPEAAVVAPVGSLYLRTDGGASTTLYVKQSGAGNTGWAAK